MSQQPPVTDSPGLAFEPGVQARWQAALRNLQTEVTRMQATADFLPPDITTRLDNAERHEKLQRFDRHLEAFQNYTTALCCLQALLAESGCLAPGVPT